YNVRYIIRDGGTLSYGPSFPDMYRQSAGYVAKILNGAKPSDLPVEQPVKFEIAINLKTAKSLGIVISPALLARADEVIEWRHRLLRCMSPILALSGHYDGCR